VQKKRIYVAYEVGSMMRGYMRTFWLSSTWKN